MKKFLPFAFLLLTACSNLPPAIKDPPAYDLGYLEAAANTAKFKTAPVRWGGTIVEVENEPSFSAIQVLAYPLSGNGRPELGETSQGRFVVKSAGFLDPAVYTKNKAITVAGNLLGSTERTIGNKALQLPMISANQIHLWEELDYYSPYYGGYGGWGYGFGYGGGFYPYGGFGFSPYYWGGYYRPYPAPRTPVRPPRRR
jgi:outer membrane lipoprotein